MPKVDQVNEATQKLLDFWESGDMPKAVARTMLARQGGTRPSDAWSLSNQLLMLIEGTEDARGFRQWEAVDRHVKKGARAIYILGPLVRKVKDKDKATGEETERTVLYGFRGIPVFRVEDTEGAEINVPEYEPQTRPPLSDVAEAWGIQVSYGPAARPGEYGWYVPGLKKIHLVTHDASVFFHELAHAAHDRIRKLRGGQQPSQEIVAETAAAALTVMFDMDPGGLRTARQYVASYAGESPETVAKAVVKHLSEVQKVLELILSEADRLSAEKATEAPEAVAS